MGRPIGTGAHTVIGSVPKIVFLDIETLPLLMLGWGIYRPSFNHKFVKRDKSIISFSYCTNTDEEVKTFSIQDDLKQFKRDPWHDKEVCKKIYDLLIDADALVGHNIDRFDIKVIQSRLASNGLECLPRINTIDTLKMAKEIFGQSKACNKLDYLCKDLGLGKKVHTDVDDWVGIANGDVEALKHMDEYGKFDVILLKRLYEKLKPMCKSRFNINLIQGTNTACPHCGSIHLQSRGYYYNKISRVTKYQCTDCRGWSTAPCKDKGVTR